VTKKLSLWTIGHSTLGIDELLHRLKAFRIETLVDVRSFPGSRRYPQFNKEQLRQSLFESGIDYFHLPELGGRRKSKPDSLNMTWRNESFRGYADYMETRAFHEGIERLLAIAGERATAIMCSEAVWWRCHRSLISDYLKVKGIKVIHIMTPEKSEVHRLTAPAKIVEGELSYRGLL
jgi:uncharacterized protein (DUF488 family)